MPDQGVSRWRSGTTPGAWSSIRRTSSPRSWRSSRGASGSAARSLCAVLSGRGWRPLLPSLPRAVMLRRETFPPAVAVSPASARSRLLGQLTDLISVVEYHHPDADPDLLRSIVERSRARSRRTSRTSASSSTRPSGRPCPRRCLIPIGRRVGAVAAPFRCALRCRSSRCRGDVAWPLPSPPSHATAEPFDRTTKVRLSRRQLVAEFDMSRAWIIRQAVATGLPVLVYQLRTAYDSGLMLHR